MEAVPPAGNVISITLTIAHDVILIEQEKNTEREKETGKQEKREIVW